MGLHSIILLLYYFKLLV